MKKEKVEVFYNAVNDVMVLKGSSSLYAEPGSYIFQGREIPNHLGLIRFSVNLKNWKSALKSKLLVKIGNL